MAGTNAADAAVTISNNMARTTDNIVNLVGTGTSRVYEDATHAIVKTAEVGSSSIESLYASFTTNVLPLLGQGIVISKDYAVELFKQYVTYLIIIDSIKVFSEVVFISAMAYLLFRKRDLSKKTAFEIEEEKSNRFFVNCFLCAFAAWAAYFLSTDLTHLVQDIVFPIGRVTVNVVDFKDYIMSAQK